MGSMQGGKAPADARDPDAYAEGFEARPMRGMDMADDALFGRLSDREIRVCAQRGRDAQALEAQALVRWGLQQAVVESRRRARKGRLQDLRAEALWDHAIAPYWGLQLGARHDFGEDPIATGRLSACRVWHPTGSRSRRRIYVGPSGRTAARVELQYDLLLTQRLILQPDIEVTLYGKSDPERAIGSGFSTLDLGLRLRYEIHPSVRTVRRCGVHAKVRQDRGPCTRQQSRHHPRSQFVIGVRAWF